MSTNILHIMPPSIHDEIGAIAGDAATLKHLRQAIDDAIETGTGGMVFTQSDGIPYVLPIVVAMDMTGVNTIYRELHPLRAAGETIPLHALPNFIDALAKAWPVGVDGNLLALSSTFDLTRTAEENHEES